MWLYLSTSDPSPTAKSTPIVKQYCSQGWQMEASLKPQSGMTSKLYRLYLPSLCLSTSSTVGSPARTSALQDMEKAWKASEAAYFSRSFAWPKKCSPPFYSWKTCPPLHLEGDFGSLEKLPRSGMIADGRLYPLLPLVHPTKEKDGSYLPTPTTMDHLPPRSVEAQKRVFQTHRKGRTYPCNLREWIIPEMWPQRLLPTPKASECTRAGIKSESKRDNPSLWYHVYKATGKKLNPQFVEWMMGLPIGWTELEPWAMQWFRNARKKRSNT